MLVTGPRFCTSDVRHITLPQRGVRSDPVVLVPPLLDHDPCLLQRVEDLPVQAFLPQLPIEALAANSGPLSERICSGIPRHSITSDTVSITSCEFSRRVTRSARHSRVYSSISGSARSIPVCDSRSRKRPCSTAVRIDSTPETSIINECAPSRLYSTNWPRSASRGVLSTPWPQFASAIPSSASPTTFPPRNWSHALPVAANPDGDYNSHRSHYARADRLFSPCT